MDISPDHYFTASQLINTKSISRAEEMIRIAEATNSKSKATYRYSLLAYVNEVIEQRAESGEFAVKINTRNTPWSVAEFQAIIPFLTHDGFKVSLDYDNPTQGTFGSIGNLDRTNQILEVSWK